MLHCIELALNYIGNTLHITSPRSSLSSKQPWLEAAFPWRNLSPKHSFGERNLRGKAASRQGCCEETLLRGNVILSVSPDSLNHQTASTTRQSEAEQASTQLEHKWLRNATSWKPQRPSELNLSSKPSRRLSRRPFRKPSRRPCRRPSREAAGKASGKAGSPGKPPGRFPGRSPGGPPGKELNKNLIRN